MAKNLILWVIIALVIIYSLELMNETTSEARNNYVAFKNELVSDQIRSVKINGKIITGEKSFYINENAKAVNANLNIIPIVSGRYSSLKQRTTSPPIRKIIAIKGTSFSVTDASL